MTEQEKKTTIESSGEYESRPEDRGEYERFLKIIARLRSADGCPWDRAQTHASLKKTCIEEACELVCGINIYEATGNAENLKEELGDLLMQVVLQARIAEEEGLFTMEDVCKGIADKMVRRHPHVFTEAKESDPEKLHANWAEIKKNEKSGKEWMEEYLPRAFEESKELIDVAVARKAGKE